MPSTTEENYLKAIYKISEKQDENIFVNTNAIAKSMQTRAASVTDMLKRLADKQLIVYQRYKGAKLTNEGELLAKKLVRKHRLWEVFLLEKLHFKWDEIHDMAEQLEHIDSDELCNRLDAFLGFPKFDPHGDPIPDEAGNIIYRTERLLADLMVGEEATIVGVENHEPAFLRHLEQQNLMINTKVRLLKCYEYDKSLQLLIADNQKVMVSEVVSRSLYVA